MTRRSGAPRGRSLHSSQEKQGPGLGRPAAPGAPRVSPEPRASGAVLAPNEPEAPNETRASRGRSRQRSMSGQRGRSVERGESPVDLQARASPRQYRALIPALPCAYSRRIPFAPNLASGSHRAKSQLRRRRSRWVRLDRWTIRGSGPSFGRCVIGGTCGSLTSHKWPASSRPPCRDWSAAISAAAIADDPEDRRVARRHVGA